MEEKQEPGLMKTIQLNDGKAGMQGLDKEMINKVIYEASKGTPYFSFQEKRQKSIDSKVNEYKSILSKISDVEKRAAMAKMDAMSVVLESERDLSHSIVHIDMDAFYAAVEMEDDPSLKDKPMAVGSSSMLSTSNYEARKYGVRAAMPGFIAKKLCPNLVIVPCNFDKYRRVSSKIRNVVQAYDPDYCPASLDEMYLDLTNYIRDKHKKQLHTEFCLKDTVPDSVEGSDYKNCFDCNRPISDENRDKMAWDIVDEIRNKIYLETNLTASAGIAPNVMLAKVGSDQNKPNGQYQIPSTVDAVLSFISTLPVKKVSGIGPVQGQILNSIGINTCADMWSMRDVVHLLFSSISSDFYLRVSKGIGSTTVKSDYVRKSIGVERTFREIHKHEELHEKCQELSDDAVEDLQMHNMVAKVVVLKFKTTEFQTHTRNQTLAYYSADKGVISRAAKRLLDLEIASTAPNPLKLRLMGVRLANLEYKDSVQSIEKHLVKIKTFFRSETSVKTKSHENECVLEQSAPSTSRCTLSVDKIEPSYSGLEVKPKEISEKHLDRMTLTKSSIVDLETYICPVCNLPQNIKTLPELNSHIDSCLSKISNDFDGNCKEPTSPVKIQLEEGSSERLGEVASTSPTKTCDEQSGFICPVCNLSQKMSTLPEFNTHIDSCLSKTTIKKILTDDRMKKRKIMVEEKHNIKKLKHVEKTGRKIEDYFR